MKVCSKCKVEKSFECFNKDKISKGGVQNKCRCCVKEYRKENKEAILVKQKEYYEENKEAILVKQKEYYKENREVLAVKEREYYKENKEAILVKMKEYRKENREAIIVKHKEYYKENKESMLVKIKEYNKENKDLVNAWAAKRRAAKLQRTPSWLSKEHHIEIREFYSLSISKREETGIDHHVDHIIPLQGELVSGLHVPWNLQVITATENREKSNTFIVDES